ncbi:hypothetical protein CASFOL_006896 [Castilleja foliolosa]|uniref:Glycosyl transferase CAP10 domain-containing protein n=1 Tax=Castilleja foliolosa TaxID=1961234 RepID=A0ABD3E829_9LAMI
MEAIRRPLARSSLVALFFAVLTVGAFLSTRFLNPSVLRDTNSPQKSLLSTKPFPNYPSKTPQIPQNTPKAINIPLNCSLANVSRTCPVDYYPSKIPSEAQNHLSPSPSMCPDYFRFMYDDLWPWRETGITQEMVMGANRTANFRLVVLDGKAYVETYLKSFQTRDTFTLWGILQLLRRYPGKLPDLDLMFDCVDWPVIKKEDFFKGPKSSQPPPPLFRYCGDEATYDIVFPDWSFWGWPEINIKPWELLSKDLKEGNKRTKWTDREPHAYWKGNPTVGESRMDLMKCNVSDDHDWKARVFAQDWLKEQKEGYKQSGLASQCKHRYKIYIEGSAWSVSEKYILACDSVTLIVKPQYYDFFTRSLMPLKHYWPIKDDNKCKSIEYAVDWGDSHQQEAQAIGKAASNFVLNDLKMDYVYDYMFHLLSEYSKLLTYKPTIPEKAVELCSESMACHAQGFEKQFMTESLVGPAFSEPCIMPPPYDPASHRSVIQGQEDGIKKVDAWEKEYWKSHDKQM